MRFLLILLMVLIYIANGALDYGFSVESKVFRLDTDVTYGVSYDPVRERYVFINQYSANEGNIVDMQSIAADYAANASDSDPDYAPKPSMAGTIIPNTGNSPWYGHEAIANDMLYVVDWYGYLVGIDLESGDTTNYIEIGSYPNGFSPLLNSVCIGAAPDDTTMAYVTTTTGDIYSVDIESNTVGGWVVTKILSDGDTILDQEGANPRTQFIAYDCAVEDEKVYFVESTGDGNLLIYDIINDAFSYNSNVLNMQLRSITAMNGVLVVAPFQGGEVYATDIPMAQESWTPFKSVASNITPGFMLQIVADYINEIIVIAASDDGSYLELYFLKSFVTTATPTSTPTTANPTTANPTTANPTTGAPTTEPTQEPTQEPTTMEPTTMKPTVYKSESMEPTTAMPTTAMPTGPEDSDDSHAVNNFHNAAFIVMFVIICNTLLFA